MDPSLVETQEDVGSCVLELKERSRLLTKIKLDITIIKGNEQSDPSRDMNLQPWLSYASYQGQLRKSLINITPPNTIIMKF